MKTNEALENLIRQAAEVAFERKQAELLKDADLSPRPDSEKRMEAILEQITIRDNKHKSSTKQDTAPKHKRKISLRYLIAAILIVAMMVGGATVVIACPAVREHIVHFFTKEDSDGTTEYTAVVSGQERQAFDISTYYTLSEVPEGFLLVDSRESKDGVFRTWQNLGNDSLTGKVTESYIGFDQVSLNTLCIINTENHAKDTVTFRGYEATRYLCPDGLPNAPNRQVLVWHTEDCMFSLSFWGPDAAGLDVLKLAETLVPTNLPEE